MADVPRIIDKVFDKRKSMMDGINNGNPSEAIRNSALAVAAIHGGVRSRAWRAYMLQFVEQNPRGLPIDPRQLARLLATDGTDGDPSLDRHRAYLVGNGTCGDTTPANLYVEVNTIDKTIGADLGSCMSLEEVEQRLEQDDGGGGGASLR